jgi:hypothetical protein
MKDSRKNTRGVRPSRFDNAAIAHGLFDSEGGEHVCDYNEDEGLGHPASGADTPSEAECVIN